MPDIFVREKRSDIMSHISGTETKPEIEVRKFLFSKGFRYRKNVSSLAGKPDIVLSKYETAIFIHGCFWHGHQGCVRSKLPDTRKVFWKKKISGNVVRDKRNVESLREQGWNVIVIWQCEISNIEKRRERLEALVNEIKQSIKDRAPASRSVPGASRRGRRSGKLQCTAGRQA